LFGFAGLAGCAVCAGCETEPLAFSGTNPGGGGGAFPAWEES